MPTKAGDCRDPCHVADNIKDLIHTPFSYGQRETAIVPSSWILRSGNTLMVQQYSACLCPRSAASLTSASACCVPSPLGEHRSACRRLSRWRGCLTCIHSQSVIRRGSRLVGVCERSVIFILRYETRMGYDSSCRLVGWSGGSLNDGNQWNRIRSRGEFSFEGCR